VDQSNKVIKAPYLGLGDPLVSGYLLHASANSPMNVSKSGSDRPSRTIGRRLGHGNPTITLSVYGHLFSNTDARAAEIMQASFANLPGTE
jgi:hypothetical protein